MNPNDAILLALTPGSPFNANGKAWRTVSALAQFAGITQDEVRDIILGDLAPQVACKPGKNPEKGFLVALKAYVPAQPQNEPVAILGGNAVPAGVPIYEVALGHPAPKPGAKAQDALKNADALLAAVKKFNGEDSEEEADF